MAKAQITIIGMNQVGVSLALVIKQQRPEVFIVGADSRGEMLRAAKKFRQIDRTETNLAAACRESSLIIVAAQVSQLRDIFSTIGPKLPPDAVVIDLSSVKAEASKLAKELLPPTVKYSGCHLILHPDAADRYSREPHVDLFLGSILVMTPAPTTAEAAIQAGSDLARTIGARPYFMDMMEHDGSLAGVEGLPGLISAALLLAVTRSPAWEELSQVAGAVFEQAVLPVIHPSIDSGAALTMNKTEVLRWLDTFLETLREVRQTVNEGNTEKLKQLLAEANQRRMEWLSARPMILWNDEEAMSAPPHELSRGGLLSPERVLGFTKTKSK